MGRSQNWWRPHGPPNRTREISARSFAAGRARSRVRERIISFLTPIHGNFEVARLEPVRRSKRLTSLPLANERTSGKGELGLTTNVSSPAESFDHQTTTFCNLVPCTLQIPSSAEQALLHPSDCHGIEMEQRTLVQSET